jgi:flavin prenyltransferase
MINHPSESKKRLVVGISGASGIIYGVKILEALRLLQIETHLVVSRAGDQTRAIETQLKAQDLRALADFSYPVNDIGAAISSGSYRTMGMIIAPCSVRTLAEIATGVTSSLLTRAADVALKERRRVVLMVRETPLNIVHLENLLKVTQMGAIVAPPVPSFYNHPTTIDEMVNYTIARALDLFDLEIPSLKRWDNVLHNINTVPSQTEASQH